MSRFTFYEFNQSGLIDRVHEVRFASLDEAQDYAARLGSRWPVEIWRGQQRVASVVPRRLQA